MRSVYQPGISGFPRPLTTNDPILGPVGGDCSETKVWRRQPLSREQENPVDALLAPLVERAGRPGSRLHYSPVGEFHHGTCRYRLPRFVFQGPPGGGGVIRLGLFAAIHGDEPEGTVASVRGATLTEALAKPALSASASCLPLAGGDFIDGLPARGGLISRYDEGVLSNPAELRPLPFEITFETPRSYPVSRQAAAGVAALRAILREYREFLAYGLNL